MFTWITSFLFVISVFVWKASCHAFSQTPQSEVDALKDIYINLGGDGWDKKDGWMKGDPCEPEWYGVKCKDGHVTYLQINENGLKGAIPNSIGNLTELYWLGLEWNHEITGELPSTIGNLVNLIGFTMPNNKLEGKIPDTFAQLTNLNLLHLGGNQLTSLPSNGVFTKMVNLVNLGVSDNQLTFCPDDGPPLILKHQMGFYCGLGGNPFKSPIPKWAVDDCNASPGV